MEGSQVGPGPGEFGVSPNPGGGESAAPSGETAAAELPGFTEPASEPAKRPPGRPRKDGRPAGTGNAAGRNASGRFSSARVAPSEETSDPETLVSPEPITLGVEQPKRKARPAAAAPPIMAMSPASAEAAVKGILDLLELISMTLVGPHTAFTQKERSMIQPAGGRILTRMNPEAAAAFGTVSDPLALLMGLAFWGLRSFKMGAPRQVAPVNPAAAMQARPAQPAAQPSPPVTASVPADLGMPPLGVIDPAGVTPIPDFIREAFGE